MTDKQNESVIIIGGGLAGCEAAWQVAEVGFDVVLYEMRPNVCTGAHTTDHLAELVCSNSLGSDFVNRAPGLLKHELRRLASLVIQVADQHRLPAGSALAVDRIGFSARISEIISAHPRIKVIREEVKTIPRTGTVIVASGPLTSDNLASDIRLFTGQQNLYFYDAIAPIVYSDSIDMAVAFRASRYDTGALDEGDYINCPMNEAEYRVFHTELLGAERIALRDFEQDSSAFFEGCLPVEILAARGENSLAFGPLRPVGLRDPRTGRRPFAVVQLRQDNAAGSLYNLVGFQTNLKYTEQNRVLRMIPGLRHAEFVRYGSMHRNTYINGPSVLLNTLQTKKRENLFFCGQIAGLEGYAANIAGGWLAGVNATRLLQGNKPITLPRNTMIGALMYYITHADPSTFQPMKANFGLVTPEDGHMKGKRGRVDMYVKRATAELDAWFVENKPTLSGTFPQNNRNNEFLQIP